MISRIRSRGARRSPAWAAVLLCLSLTACAPTAREVGKKAFWKNDFVVAEKQLAEYKDKPDKNFVLYNLEYGLAAFEGGDYLAAKQAFGRATQVMRGHIDNLRGILSLVGSESTKFFKGDPFERAMANFYDGLIYYRWEDFGNARAAFHQALMADKMVNDAKYADDFAAAHYLIGRCYVHLGRMDEARRHFERARELRPKNPYFSEEAIKQHNVVIILELGKAPEKVATGPGGSLDEYKAAAYIEKKARVYANGQLLGESWPIADLFFQAKTSGRSGKDTIQAAKGVVREGLAQASMATKDEDASLVLLLAAALMPAGADLRQWDLLPGEVQVVSAKLPPGDYTFKIDFLNSQGSQLPEYKQVWHHVPVKARGDTLLVFRSGPRKSNGNLPPVQQPVFTDESHVETIKKN